jgi:hypothetical protein
MDADRRESSEVPRRMRSVSSCRWMMWMSVDSSSVSHTWERAPVPQRLVWDRADGKQLCCRF